MAKTASVFDDGKFFWSPPAGVGPQVGIAGATGGSKVVHGYWIKGQEAIPGLHSTRDVERRVRRHEHAQYGVNRKSRRKNIDYQLHVKGWL